MFPSTDSFFGLAIFSFVVSAAAVISPGPVTAAIVSEAPRRGWRAGTLIAAGHIALELVLVALIGLGLASSLASPSVRQVLGIVGGVVLLLMAGSYLLGAWNGSIRLPTQEAAGAPRLVPLPVAGMLATVSNPFWYTWWVTVAAGYLAEARVAGVAGLAAFYVGHATADLSWDSGLAAAVGAGRRWLTPARYRALLYITGGFMLYLGTQYLRTALFPG
ncbi:MAG TPA: LysE family transporter [Anaerolineales bacterium]|nr:LysE family transporter [Anaerolineales bacterium]